VAYLDAGSTQPLNPAGQRALTQAVEQGWADPARLHSLGRSSQMLAQDARHTIAEVLGIRSDELHILPSGTAAVHAAIRGLNHARRREARPAVISSTEHSSVINATHAINNVEPVLLTVDQFGLIDIDQLKNQLVTTGARWVAVQSVNQETGTRQDTDVIAALCQSHAVPYLVDAAQSVGHEVIPQNWDVLTASAHKWGGPAGIGVLAIKTGTPWHPLDPTHALGTPGQGFANVPALVAAAAALVQAEQDRINHRDRLMRLTSHITDVVAKIPGIDVVGHPTQRAAHLLTLNAPRIAGDVIVEQLDRRGISVASGSACSSLSLDPSHVLLAMGIETYGNVRIGLMHDTTEADVEEFLTQLPLVLQAIGAPLDD
jgi:cysteine desulfurase